MNSTQLPQGYEEAGRIDLQKDKKTAVLVNAMALVLAAATAAVGMVIHPLRFELNGLLPLLVLVLGTIALFVVHELIHGIFMKRYSGQKPKYGFTGLYAYCGCESAYFDRRSYMVIAWSPVVVIGIVLLLLNVLCPQEWFWGVYLFQIINISGAAGDCYVSFLMQKQHHSVLIRDTGVHMTYYIKQ